MEVLYYGGWIGGKLYPFKRVPGKWIKILHTPKGWLGSLRGEDFAIAILKPQPIQEWITILEWIRIRLVDQDTS
jgi:hypothetical protein